MVVLHRSSQQRPGYLRDVLGRAATIPVVVAAPAQRLCRGICYIGEPANHLTLAPGCAARLVEGPQDRYRNSTIDLLFASVAVNAGARGVAVVLSGALSDGTSGVTLVHRAGGTTMVLAPGNKPHGMQQSAIDESGPMDVIGSSAAIAAAIIELARGLPS
jgi:two-component system chemotaxis response regulator CheB